MRQPGQGGGAPGPEERLLTLARTPEVRRSRRITDRDEIFTDGSHNDQTDSGGWAAIRLRHTSGRHTGTTNQEMELRAIAEAVKMDEGLATVVSGHEGIVGVAQRRMTLRWSPSVWKELYEVAAGKDVEYQ